MSAPVSARLIPSRRVLAADAASDRDARLPAVGTVLAREYDGARHDVTVGADGFVYRGAKHRPS